MHGQMLERPRADPVDEPIRSHAHAEQTLGDTAYLAYVLVQACKLFIALACKRWPRLK